MGHETINAHELQEPALHTSSGNPQADPINIAYCFDKNYRQHFAASICSLIKNANEFRALNIFIVTDAADAVFKSKIEIIIPPTKTRRITWIIIDEALVGGLPLDGKSHFTASIYYRLLLPSLLSGDVKKIIYLDSDTIVQSDLSTVYDIPMDGYSLAGAMDINSTIEAERIGVSRYINSGVLLMNLDFWRRNLIDRKCLSWISVQKDLILGDQDAINIVCQSSIYVLGKEWNYCLDPRSTCSPDELKSAKIVHFITPDKPWHSWYDVQLSQIYDYYLNLTPWAQAPKQSPKTIHQLTQLARSLLKQGRLNDAASAYEQVIRHLTLQLIKKNTGGP